MKSHRDLVYVQGGHERHKLDLYLPEKGVAEAEARVSESAAESGAKGRDVCPPVRESTVSKVGLQLDGERWTYRDGDFTMKGILLT